MFKSVNTIQFVNVNTYTFSKNIEYQKWLFGETTERVPLFEIGSSVEATIFATGTLTMWQHGIPLSISSSAITHPGQLIRNGTSPTHYYQNLSELT